MSKRKTNTEFIVELMEFSGHGAMMQVFVMTAIERYAQMALKERLPDGGMINPDIWQGVAREALDKLTAHFGD